LITQAAAIFTNVWNGQNAIERQQWQEQLDQDATASALLASMETEARRAEAADLERLRQEDIDKEKEEQHKLEKGEYMPLWYFTNTGLHNVMKSFSVIDEDTLSLIKKTDPRP
jgi:hypothetical protein